MSDQPDYIVEIAGVEAAGQIGGGQITARGRRRWLGMHFDCCGLYCRIYRNKEGTAYVGHCPRCARPVRVPIGPDGTDCRLFRAR